MALRHKSQTKKQKAYSSYGRIGVLMGGPSSEREISLKSGKAVYESLKNLGLEVVAIDVQSDRIKENIRLVNAHKITCAFLALHGRFGEDGQIQEILSNLGIPFTGSDKLASRLAMDKIASRKILEVYGLPVPRYKAIEKADARFFPLPLNGFALPLVIKPASHGSSVGLSIIDSQDNLKAALELAFQFDQRALLEEYIAGREITVGILEERALPVIEIIPKKRFFDYEAKYSHGLTDYVVPARIDRPLSRKIQAVALRAHKLLGCRGCSRVDMILSQENIPFVLELNTIPGMTETSLLPKAAKVRGIDFTNLCLKLINIAYEKK